VGDLKLSASQRARAYHDAAAHYEERSGGTVPAVVPYAGGITVADKEIDEFDEGKVQPYFTVGAMNNPEAGGTHQTGSVTH
jgi:hypothetical protein